MEYVILIIVLAVLAVGAGGFLLFVRPRRGRTLEAPKSQPPPAAQATTTPAGSGDAIPVVHEPWATFPLF